MQRFDDTPPGSGAARTVGAVVGDSALWTVFALSAALTTVVPVGGQPVSVLAPVMGAPAFLLGRGGWPTRVMAPAFTALVAVQALVAAMGQGTVTGVFFQAAAVVVCAVLPWLFGRYLRRRAATASFGWRRAELLERERDLVAERERLRERARIAEEMHDSLGHELSLIVVRAGAMQVAPDYGERELRRAAEEVRAGAAGAVERLQQIIGIMRETGDPLAGEPLSQSVGDLVDRARGAGMAVEVRGAERLAGLPEQVQRVLCRFVQETLTNAAKHAPGAEVVVAAEEPEGGGVVVRVRNGAASHREPLAAQASGGRGLAGLARRLRPLGGAVEAGACPGGGFEALARLPATVSPAREGAGSAAESAAHFAAAQRRALSAVILVPAALLVLLMAAWLGYYGYVSANSVLEPQQYDRLRVGQELPQVESVLPPMRMLDPPSERGGAPADGARCRFYLSETALPGAATTAYRLCFDENRLVDKDTVPVGT